MAAPKGNKYAVGNNGGRPPHYSDPEVLQAECDEYFEFIKGEYDSEKKEWIREPEPPTVTGLTLYLGFCERNSLDEYEKKQEFSHIIKRARYRVEHGYEKRLHGDKNTGAIFALKNMGWKDIQKVESTNLNFNTERKRIEFVDKDGEH